MDILTPITREEMLMNDETLTPITREEKILAGEDLTPVTRREYFLKKYRHAGGDVMVEGLSVTENGTYTAPEGKAYSPVEVAVPLPENAYLLKEASGALVSFTDGSDLPMPSFVCKIEAVQSGSGEPSPENVRPISGHTGVDAWVFGKNILPYPYSETTKTLNDVTFTDVGDGTIKTSGTASARTVFKLKDATSNYTPPKGTYIVSKGYQNAYTTFVVDGYNGNTWVKTLGRSSSVDDTEIVIDYEDYNRVVMYIEIANGVDTSNMTFKPMMRLATIADTTYEPYNPASQNIQVSWQTEAGEVFGGYVDLVSGELTATHKEITFDGVTSGKMFSARITGSTNSYYISLPDGFDFNTTGRVSSTDMKRYGMINSHYDYTDDSSVGFYAGIGTTTGYLQPRILFGANSNITTVELANQWLATQYTNGTPWQIVYPLATPITIQLTPTQIKSLLGNNNAWCSTGDVDIQYFAKEVTG